MIRLLKHRADSVAAVACGVAVSSGIGFVVWLAALVPTLFIAQAARRESFRMALLYYLGASWPIMVVCRNYVRSGNGLWIGLLLWVAASSALALPWLWAWSPRPIAAFWRAPAAILFTAIPPLGIIGWAHPFSTAGILLPGSRWLGLVAILLLPRLLIAKPRHTLAVFVPAVLVLNAFYGSSCSAPPGWVSVDTHFGNVAASILNEYAAIQWVCDSIRASSARVLVFPESIVSHWTRASASLLRKGRNRPPTSVEIILLGAQIFAGNDLVEAAEFDDAIRVLHNQWPRSNRISSTATDYRNTLIYLDNNGWRAVDQHMPVPLAMWKPFAAGGVRLNWQPNRPVEIAAQRVCLLICYEALIPWPVLSSLYDEPTIICLIANNYWTTGTPIARYQLEAVKSWSRLFRIPYLKASNH